MAQLVIGHLICRNVLIYFFSFHYSQTFEDMEFHQMEEEAHKQTEREELLKEIWYMV